MQKKLYRSPDDGILLGIASGIGHYFEKDPVLIRIAFVIAAFLTRGWPIVLLYAVLFFIIPLDPAQAKVSATQEPKDVTNSEQPPADSIREVDEQPVAETQSAIDEDAPEERMDS